MPNVWPDWVGTSSATTTTTWLSWNVDGSTTTTTCDAWTSWTGTGTTYTGQITGHYIASPESLSERERGIRETRARSRQMRERVAQRTAEKLLLDHLTDQQQEEWKTHKYFHIETANGQRRYRIKRGLAGNVALVNGEQAVRRYCMHVYHPEGRVPDEDNVLAQKLLIEANEDEFLRLANVC